MKPLRYLETFSKDCVLEGSHLSVSKFCTQVTKAAVSNQVCPLQATKEKRRRIQ